MFHSTAAAVQWIKTQNCLNQGEYSQTRYKTEIIFVYNAKRTPDICSA